METSFWWPATLIAALAFGAWLVWRMPRLVGSRTGLVLLGIALGVMPILLLAMGTTAGMQRSQQRSFCASCHEMEHYEKSLLIDDSSFVPAAHFQQRLVPQDTACYSCHTDYTLYGGVEAKINGMKHVWVHYTSDPPELGSIKLYKKYPNDNCLKCHKGARKFESKSQHTGEDAGLDKLYSGEVSCQAQGCHDLNHAIPKLGDFDYWKPTDEAVKAFELDMKRLDALKLPPPTESMDDLFD